MPGKGKAAAPPSPIPTPTPTATFFVSVSQAESLRLNPDTAKTQLADASAVYSQIESDPTLVSRDTLVQWATATWGDGAVDRVNSALSLLQQMNLVYQVN